VRKVDRDGFISFKNRPWRISKALRGEPIALRPPTRTASMPCTIAPTGSKPST